MKLILKHLDDIEISIKNDLLDVIRFHERKEKRTKVMGGFHNIPRSVFCYIDHLGELVFNHEINDTSLRAVRYMEEYFVGKNAVLYKKLGALIYVMWRHGTVHEYDPKTLKLGTNYLLWLTVMSPKKENRRNHLKIFRMERKKKCIYYLCVNNDQLIDDLIDSVHILKERLRKDTKLKKVVVENYKKISKHKQINELWVSKSIKSICEDQFNSASENIYGILDRNLGVKKYFCDNIKSKQNKRGV